MMWCSVGRIAGLCVKGLNKNSIAKIQFVGGNSTVRFVSSQPPIQQWEHIINMLVCPLDKGELKANKDPEGRVIELVNERIGVAYSVNSHGILFLTPTDARVLNPAAKQHISNPSQIIQEEGESEETTDPSKYFTESKQKLW